MAEDKKESRREAKLTPIGTVTRSHLFAPNASYLEKYDVEKYDVTLEYDMKDASHKAFFDQLEKMKQNAAIKFDVDDDEVRVPFGIKNDIDKVTGALIPTSKFWVKFTAGSEPPIMLEGALIEDNRHKEIVMGDKKRNLGRDSQVEIRYIEYPYKNNAVGLTLNLLSIGVIEYIAVSKK